MGIASEVCAWAAAPGRHPLSCQQHMGKWQYGVEAIVEEEASVHLSGRKDESGNSGWEPRELQLLSSWLCLSGPPPTPQN